MLWYVLDGTEGGVVIIVVVVGFEFEMRREIVGLLVVFVVGVLTEFFGGG